MKLSQFDYDLPDNLIAQTPAEKRDQSRLLVVNRSDGSLTDTRFSQLPTFLDAGDVLVVNNTHVFPARLFGEKVPGGAAIEMLLLDPLQEGEWTVIAYRASRLKKGTRVVFADSFDCEVVEVLSDGRFRVRFQWEGSWQDALDSHGHIPLPPYIERDKETDEDRQRYQTVYAQHHQAYDSAAAPTAGLHFTDELLNQIRKQGVVVCPVNLRVGLDTFLPMRVETILEHKMHSEHYHLPLETAQKVEKALANNKRVLAVGTTSLRTLEGSSTAPGKLQHGHQQTDIFIYPGYSFNIVNSMITNFHLPRTTLLLLISALMGNDLRTKAYDFAIEKQYRFYSYGDAMLIL